MSDREGVGAQGSPDGGTDRVHAARGVAWGGLESAAGAVTGLVVTPLIIRSFGLEGLGLWAASWSLAHSAGLFDLGIGASYARFTASAITRRDARDLNGAVAAGIGFHLVIAALLALLALSVGPFVIIRLAPTEAMRSDAAWILSSAFAVVLLRLVLSAYRGVLAGAQRIDLLGRIGASVSILEGLGSVTILLGGGSLMHLAWNSLAAAVLTSGLEAWRAHTVCPDLRVRPFCADRHQWRAMIDFGLKLQAVRAAELLAQHAPRLILAAGPGLMIAGLYDLAARVARILMALGRIPLPVVLPLATRLQALGDRRRLAILFEGATRYVALLILPCAAVLLLDAPAFLIAWTGDAATAAAATTARLLIVAAVVTLLASPSRLVLRGLGYPGLEAVAAVGSTVVHLMLSLLLAPSFGAEGVAFGALAGALTAACVLAIGGRRVRPDLMTAPFCASLAGTLVAGFAGFAGAWVIRLSIAAPGLAQVLDRPAALLRLLAESAGALTLFVIVALALGRLRRDDVALLRAVRGTV